MKLGSPVRITRKPLRAPMPSASTSDDEDRQPDVDAVLGHQDAGGEAGGADHRAGGEVELAADHQQRHGDGHDADRRAP